MKIPELFAVLAEHFMEYAPLTGKGVVSKQIGDYIVKTTADGKTKDEDGWEIDPFTFHIFKNGWLVAVVSPNGGETLLNENDLIETFKAELKIEEKENEDTL